MGAPPAAGGPGSSSLLGRGDGGRQPPAGRDLARPMDIQMKKREKDSEWHLMSQIKVAVTLWPRERRERPTSRPPRPTAPLTAAACRGRARPPPPPQPSGKQQGTRAG